MRIYLSGAITGHTDFIERFDIAEKEMREQFPSAEILNPVKFCSDIPQGSPWVIYMERCLQILKTCTHIKLLTGWHMSNGACVEFYYAKGLVLEII